MNFRSIKKVFAAHILLFITILTVNFFCLNKNVCARELIDAMPKNTPFFLMLDYKKINFFPRIINIIEKMEIEATEKIQIKFFMTFLREISPLAEVSQIAAVCLETDFKKLEKNDWLKNVPFALIARINSAEKFAALEKNILKMITEDGDAAYETAEIFVNKEKVLVNVLNLKGGWPAKIIYYVQDDIIIIGFGEISSGESVSKILGILKSENSKNLTIGALEKFTKVFKNDEKVKNADCYIYFNNSFLLPYLISKIDDIWMRDKTRLESKFESKAESKNKDKISGEISESEALGFTKVYISEVLRFIDSILISFKYDNASVSISSNFWADGSEAKSPFVKYFSNKKETAFNSLELINDSFVFTAVKMDFDVSSFIDDIKKQFEFDVNDTSENSIALMLKDIQKYVPEFFGEAFFSGLAFDDKSNGFIYGINPKSVSYCLKLINDFLDLLSLEGIKVEIGGKPDNEIITFNMQQEKSSFQVYRNYGYLISGINTDEVKTAVKNLQSKKADKKAAQNNIFDDAVKTIKNRPNSFIVTYVSEPSVDLMLKYFKESNIQVSEYEINMLKILKSAYLLGYIEGSGISFDSKFDISREDFIKILNDIAKEGNKTAKPVLEKK